MRITNANNNAIASVAPPTTVARKELEMRNIILLFKINDNKRESECFCL
jgi:hypothetical protein